MKFKSLHLENYQAHKDTTIDFTAGLNIIIGESDMGKSSILRALRKLVRDVPAGKDHINKDATSMKISLTVVDDNDHEYIIIREVTPSKNLYHLDKQDFGGFGREIPEEIQNTLEMFLIELENSEKIDLHFFDQHDAPFMVARGSAGTRSKLLGRIAGLHTLDRGIVAVNKDIRAGNSLLKTRSEDRDKLQKNVDETRDTSNDHILHDTCKSQLQKIVKELSTLEKLTELLKELRKISKEGKEIKQLFDSIPEIVVDFPKMREDVRRLNKLQECRKTLSSIDMEITKLPTVQIDIDINFGMIRENIQKLRKLQEYCNALSSINSQIAPLDSIEFDKDIEKAQNEWAKALAELKICPVCKQSTVNIETHCIQS
jgi:exonuclease SbcC